jgi:hypothetical protein
MQPQEVLQYCAEVLKEMGFEVELKGDFLYYKDEPLVYWVRRVYPIDEDKVEGYGAFVAVSEIWEDGEHEIPEEVENAEDILITYSIVAIIYAEVLQGISSAYFETPEKFCLCPPHLSRLTIEIPIYKSEEMNPSDYRIAVTWWSEEKGEEKVAEPRPTDFETLRKVTALALL